MPICEHQRVPWDCGKLLQTPPVRQLRQSESRDDANTSIHIIFAKPYRKHWISTKISHHFRTQCSHRPMFCFWIYAWPLKRVLVCCTSASPGENGHSDAVTKKCVWIKLIICYLILFTDGEVCWRADLCGSGRHSVFLHSPGMLVFRNGCVGSQLWCCWL